MSIFSPIIFWTWYTDSSRYGDIEDVNIYFRNRRTLHGLYGVQNDRKDTIKFVKVLIALYKNYMYYSVISMFPFFSSTSPQSLLLLVLQACLPIKTMTVQWITYSAAWGRVHSTVVQRVVLRGWEMSHREERLSPCVLSVQKSFHVCFVVSFSTGY